MLILRCSLTIAALAFVSQAHAQQSSLFSYAGDSPGDLLGTALAALDDVNADGVPDFAISAPGDDVRKVRIYSGATGAYLQAFFGAAPGDGFGSALSSVLDVDGDLERELAVAATTTGHVSLVSVGASHVLWTTATAVTKLASAGDVDGDGKGDVVVLASGTPTSTVKILAGADGSTLLEFAAQGEWLFLDAGGDTDGDGVPDIVLANPFWPGTTYGLLSGKVQVHSGADGQVLRVHEGGFLFDLVGWGVTLLGDLDGDAKADYAFGQPGDHWLGDDGHAHVHSGASGALIRTLAGSQAYGTGVFSIGDVDGDGRIDLGVVHDGGAKRLRMYTSATWDELYSVSVPSTFSFSEADLYNVVTLGDLDGNPKPELCVGYPTQSPEGTAIVVTPCTTPESYCIGAANSIAAQGASMGWTGNTSISANEFELRTFLAPPGQFGVYIYGSLPGQSPLGNGFLCLDATPGLFRVQPPTLIGSFAATGIDFTAPQFTQGPGALLPGSTWNFQFWYRDPAAGGAGYNLSNALRVTFCP